MSPFLGGLSCCPCLDGGSVVVDSLLIVAYWGSVFGLFFVIQYSVSFYFCKHLNGEEELVALL